MKSKLLFLDLVVCASWMLGIYGSRYVWGYQTLVVVTILFLSRLTVSFVLAKREKRAWLPLGIFAIATALTVLVGHTNGIAEVVDHVLDVGHIEFTREARHFLGGGLIIWLVLAPFICYLYLLFRKKLERTTFSWIDLIGGILWHDRQAKTYSAVLGILLTALFAGLSMNTRTCQFVCLTAVPLTYWIVCRYYRTDAEKLWVLVMAMLIFWYAQILAGVWRMSLLAVSLLMVVYVTYLFYRNTKNYLVANVLAIYLGLLLPSLAIGYNQYAYINYARQGFRSMDPYDGIIPITDKTGEFVGLRDRYGLLVEPKYERIYPDDYTIVGFCYRFRLHKDGYVNYFYVYDSEVKKPNDIVPDLQKEVRRIIENHLEWNGSEYDDRGQIKVTELYGNKTIADVRIMMYGNPHINYYPNRFLPDDTIAIGSGQFYRNDSTVVPNGTKRVKSYSVNIPTDSTAKYNIYVRLATDSLQSDSVLIELVGKVAELHELK